MKTIAAVLAGLIVIALSGCAPQRAMYDLSGRDPAKLAVIYGKKRVSSLIHTRDSGAAICGIDGNNLDPLLFLGSCEAGPLYLEPGRHEFTVLVYVGMIDSHVKPNFELLAGHTYYFKSTGFDSGFSSSGGSMTMSATSQFWVEDVTAGTVVYGRRPNTRQ